MDEYIICKQALDDIESLLSRGLLEEDTKNRKLRISTLGQKILKKRRCSEKIENIVRVAEDLVKKSY